MTQAQFEPKDPGYAQRVRDSFALQGAMGTIGAALGNIAPGEVEILLDWAPGLTQQHGFLHAGMVATALDSACGYAGFTLMPPDAGVLTIEFKINLLAPAKGERFRFVGTVLKAGRTITVAEGKAYALAEGGEKLVASMTCTLMTVLGRSDVVG